MSENYESWNEFFYQLKSKDYIVRLHDFLESEYKNHICYPPRQLLFNAFRLTPLKSVRVVIVGQDPYPNPNQAMGLSFSVPQGVTPPPSLINIYKEIEKEFGMHMNMASGDLTYLAKQGVLLLNSILSVRKQERLSHDTSEYRMFLSDVLSVLNEQEQPIVFMLWGGPARKLKVYLNNPRHLVLEATHPSPLGANQGGWFGCNHFIKANEFLVSNGSKAIVWQNQEAPQF